MSSLLPRRKSSKLVAVVMVTRRDGAREHDSEREVHSLKELYDACRKTSSAELVRVLLRGADGEVTLDFGNVRRP